MKVLMISKDGAILAPDSEARRRMESYAQVLGELHIVVIAGQGNAFPATPPLYPVRNNIPALSEKNSLKNPVAPFPVRNEAGISNGIYLYHARTRIPFFRLLAAWHTAHSLARRTRFDLVTAQGPDETGIIAWRAACAGAAKLQMQIHTDVMSPWYRRASWKENIRFRLARFLMPRAECIRVVSERIKASLLKAGLVRPGVPIVVLPIATDLGSYLNARATEEDKARFRGYDIKMIAAGRFLDKEKNFSLLIDMMSELVREFPHVLLVLAGEGPDRERYRKRIAKLGLEKHVILEPWREDLASFFHAFDIFLLPSYFEGWGRSAVEAMASGMPVVMTDVGLAGDVVRDNVNGRVVAVGDTKKFQDAVGHLCRHPEERQRMAEAARRTAEALHAAHKNYINDYRAACEQCLRK